MKWILCDERLPEEGQMVLTTIRGHDVIIPQEGETLEEAIERIWNDVCYVSIGFIGSDGWYGADGFPEVVHPIAWMPLPKPYTADRKTEPTISKMEQVEEPTTQTETQNSNLTFEKADEPQTEQVGVPFGEMDEATFKSHCLNCQRDTADIKCLDCDGNKYFLPYGSKTDCAWK